MGSGSEGTEVLEPSLLHCDWFGTNRARSKWTPIKIRQQWMHPFSAERAEVELENELKH